MLRVDTSWLLTEVIQGQPLTDRTDEQLIREPVSETQPPGSTDFDVKVAVAVPADGAIPEPAPVAAIELALKAKTNVSYTGPLVASCDHATKYTEHIGRALLDHLRERAA